MNTRNEYAAWLRTHGDLCGGKNSGFGRPFWQAAHEIERLQAENERLEKERAKANERYERLASTLTYVKGERTINADDYITRIEAENERLREALDDLRALANNITVIEWSHSALQAAIDKIYLLADQATQEQSAQLITRHKEGCMEWRLTPEGACAKCGAMPEKEQSDG